MYSTHIIITGLTLSETKLRNFFREFYHPDHMVEGIVRSVLIFNQPPSLELLEMLGNSKVEDYIHYISGSIFDESTLKLGKVSEAQAAFIMSNQYDEQGSQRNDSFSVLASKAIYNHNQNLKIFVQLISRDFQLHSWCRWNAAFSIDEIKTGILYIYI